MNSIRTFNNLLVTGGAGFIGANFIRYLLTESDFSGRVVNIDKLTYAGNPDNLLDIAETHPDRYVFLNADICDRSVLQKALAEYDIDGVCHFAAESHVDRSIDGPEDFIQTNIVGTFRLLEAVRARKNHIRLFHHVGTDEVYGSLPLAGGRFTETTPYDPSSPYSASKAASDHLVRAYARTYGLPVTITNCSNNYGPYQFPEKLIPLMIENALEHRPLPVYGDGSNVRDWLYVTDHCRAVYRVMESGRPGETYNVGGDCEMPNREVVHRICDILDEIRPGNAPRRALIRYVTDRPGHDLRYAMDSTKLQQTLSWKPLYTFETGLRETIGWYMQNRTWVERVKSGDYRKWVSRWYQDR